MLVSTDLLSVDPLEWPSRLRNFHLKKNISNSLSRVHRCLGPGADALTHWSHRTVSEICVSQSLDLICAKFNKFLVHGQAHKRQMGEWPWHCTTTIPHNFEWRKSIKWLQRYGFHKSGSRQAVRPNHDNNTLQPGRLRGKKQMKCQN